MRLARPAGPERDLPVVRVVPRWRRLVHARGAVREVDVQPLADRRVAGERGGEVVREPLVKGAGFIPLALDATRLDPEAVDHGVTQLVIDDVGRARGLTGKAGDGTLEPD